MLTSYGTTPPPISNDISDWAQATYWNSAAASTHVVDFPGHAWAADFASCPILA